MADAKHTPGPWKTSVGGVITAPDPFPGASNIPKRQVVAYTATMDLGPQARGNKHVLAAAPELLAYAMCEEARTHGEDIAETVLKRHGFDPSECTSHVFMDRMRRAAIAKATGSAS